MSYQGFTVLSNYLFHVRKSCLEKYAEGALNFRALHEGILKSNITTAAVRHSNAVSENVKKTLHNCWLTELNLHQEFYFDIDAIDVVYFLGWKIVQAYYICFLSLRALYELSLGTSRFSHHDLLSRFAEDNQTLGFIYPFDISYGKDGFKTWPALLRISTQFLNTTRAKSILLYGAGQPSRNTKKRNGKGPSVREKNGGKYPTWRAKTSHCWIVCIV